MDPAGKYEVYPSLRQVVTQLTGWMLTGIACVALGYGVPVWPLRFFCLITGMAAVAGVISSVIELFHIRKPAVICTPEGIRLHLVMHPREKRGRQYIGFVNEFISWKQIRGISLRDRMLRLDYEKDLQWHKRDIYFMPLAVRAPLLYEVIRAFRQKYGT